MSTKESVFLFMILSVGLWCLWIYTKRKPSHATGSIDAVVPAYNEEHCIENTLLALLANKYIHRVICVNDGSTDNTKKILDALASSGKWGHRLQVIHQKNTGKGGALMTGIRQVKSAFVFLTDADTLVRNDDSLGYLLAEIEAGADATGGVCDVNLHNAGWLACMRASVKAPVVILQRVFQQLLGGSPFLISGGCGLFKTGMLLKHGFSDRTKVEDLDLCWTLVKNGYKITCAPRCVVYTQECRYVQDEWRKYKRWIVGYAVCLRLHHDMLLSRFGLGSMLFSVWSVFWGVFVIADIIVGVMISEKSPMAAFSLIFPWSWLIVLFALAAIQAVRHRNFKLIPTVPLTIPHLLMTYAVWVVHGIRGLITGKEPARDKPTRYAQIVGKIKKQLQFQLPGILHIEMQHLAYGQGCLMLAQDSVTQWITALHVPDNSQDSLSAFFRHLIGNYPIKVRKFVMFENPDGNALRKNFDIQRFCQLTNAEFILVQAQRVRKINTLLVHSLQKKQSSQPNEALQYYVHWHNQHSPMKRMHHWYTRYPNIFITPPSGSDTQQPQSRYPATAAATMSTQSIQGS